jgi:ferric-dicitrate binding protein FerR (iron transport regulator)
MSFDNTPLPQVFDELAQHFKVTIDYTPEELNGLSFSGTIFYNDSIPVLLQAIAHMNELSVTDIPDGFSIKKALRE